MTIPDTVLRIAQVRPESGLLVEENTAATQEDPVDVDFTSRNMNPGFPRVPRLCRIVEWTRGGRMILRSAERAQPVPRDPRWDEHDRLIQAWVDVCETLGAQIRQDITPAPGEVLVIDNYRCLHGVRRNDGLRTTYVLRCKSRDAC